MTLPARAESVGIARRRVAELGREMNLGERRLGDLRTVVSEACMNAAIHAYERPDADAGEGDFSVSADVRPDAVTVTVADRGTGICPRPAFGSSRARLGLLLIAALASRFEIRSRPGGGTSVRIEMA